MFKILKKILRKMLIATFILIILLVGIGFIFIKTSPQFGGKASPEKAAEYALSENNVDQKFINLKGVKMEMTAAKIFSAAIDYFKSKPNTIPAKNLPVNKLDSTNISDYNNKETRFAWFGHSSFIWQINNTTILIDPMLSEVPAPHPLLGNKRFSEEIPLTMDQMPTIDIVLLSHDHYDHLDYETIKTIKDRVTQFVCPLGVGVHLQAWGVEESKIRELDWWQTTEFQGIELRCTPSQHFSGRGLSDGNKTLWASWIIESSSEKLFFSGDSGYGDHFKTIGEKYGPFDLAMMECGQYDKNWSEIHMFPEETAQAAQDVRAKLLFPIHWGAFKLANHSWSDPINRVTIKAQNLGVEVLCPPIGTWNSLKKQINVQNDWWTKIK